MDDQELHELCMRAVRAWGIQNQSDMVIEESGELSDAILKFRRGRASKEKVIEEIADVQIMLEQAKIMFCLDCIDRYHYEAVLSGKAQRLRTTLDKHDNVLSKVIQ
jgi:NTP pyrophosphatase (non-canonical NTP hydrolase)